MNTLSIILLGLPAIVPHATVDLTVTAADVARPAAIHIAQTRSDCCRRRDSRSTQWLKIGTDEKQCIKLNKRFDRKERGDDILERNGRIWWDERCDNKT